MDLASSGKRLAKQLLALQLILAVLLGVVSYFFSDLSSAISVVTGGTLSVIVNAIFAYYVFRFAGARKNKEIVDSMKKGNKLKLFASVIGLGVLFQWPVFQNAFVILGYCLIMLLHYPILIILNRVSLQSTVQPKIFKL